MPDESKTCGDCMHSDGCPKCGGTICTLDTGKDDLLEDTPACESFEE